MPKVGEMKDTKKIKTLYERYAEVKSAFRGYWYSFFLIQKGSELDRVIEQPPG
jgi:hypothetical protein